MNDFTIYIPLYQCFSALFNIFGKNNIISTTANIFTIHNARPHNAEVNINKQSGASGRVSFRIRNASFKGQLPQFAPAPLFSIFLEFQISTFHRACRMLAEHAEHAALVAELSRLPIFLSLGKDCVDFLRSLSLALDSDDV